MSRQYRPIEFISLLGEMKEKYKINHQDYCRLYDLFMDYLLRIDGLRRLGVGGNSDPLKDLRSGFSQKLASSGLSLRTLSKQLGISVSTLSRFHNGQGAPEYNHMLKIIGWMNNL